MTIQTLIVWVCPSCGHKNRLPEEVYKQLKHVIRCGECLRIPDHSKDAQP